MIKEVAKVRVDKWLWTVRIFKSRSLATKLCKSGKVKLGEKICKPATLIFPDDIVHVHKQGYNLTFKVVKLIKSRVSATLAEGCYEDLTPEDEYNKFKNWFVGKAGSEFREKGTGRPTKKERRTIEDFKDQQWWEYIDTEED